MNVSSSPFDTAFLPSFEVLHSGKPFYSVQALRSIDHTSPLSIFVTVLIVLIAYLTWLSSSSAPIVKAPFAGYRSVFEPTFLLRLRFLFNAVNIMKDGYHKFKNSCYVVRRMDTDVTVIAPKYFEELRKSGLDDLNSTHANIHNMCGSYTDLDIIKVNDQFRKVITHHLNPNINGFMEAVRDEMNHSFEVDMPDFQGHRWTSVDVHTLIRRVIGRIAARMMLGYPYCRDEKMMSITESHTICIFAVTLILRRFPPFLHGIISILLPPRWQIWRNIRTAKNIAGPIIEKHRAAQANRKAGTESPEPESAEPQSMLEWMVDTAEDDQNTAHSLVSMLLAVTIAAVYTSSQVTSALLIFLAANPDYIEELRQEIEEHADDVNQIDPNKLPKLEACLAETLRLHPPLTNAPQRRAMRDVVLRDGTVIPKGALVAFPCLPIATDPEIYPEPMQFQPFRKTNFAPVTIPTKTKLAFGWGVQACPGRFVAAKEMKLVVARLIMEYDISLAPGVDEMRRVVDIEDLRVLDPRFRILMRRRVRSA